MLSTLGMELLRIGLKQVHLRLNTVLLKLMLGMGMGRRVLYGGRLVSFSYSGSVVK